MHNVIFFHGRKKAMTILVVKYGHCFFARYCQLPLLLSGLCLSSKNILLSGTGLLFSE